MCDYIKTKITAIREATMHETSYWLFIDQQINAPHHSSQPPPPPPPLPPSPLFPVPAWKISGCYQSSSQPYPIHIWHKADAVVGTVEAARNLPIEQRRALPKVNHLPHISCLGDGHLSYSTSTHRSREVDRSVLNYSHNSSTDK